MLLKEIHKIINVIRDCLERLFIILALIFISTFFYFVLHSGKWPRAKAPYINNTKG